ncbi:hypothetical protein NADFUDRAFT_39792 [Nadsonia fulvescens var. elongata DSM 6958]|uniref:PH-like domain-containing protein n=1 Tax=Nadsonia fulvescens var. elongata DSM 6958 TaxID=857566 RepID=A0A1E3PSJ9_9ASCO|nr:hypothetical protein NADFUDRAFT_39792 [Nadsonia fulvescens var. elongata DSM 6958]
MDDSITNGRSIVKESSKHSSIRAKTSDSPHVNLKNDLNTTTPTLCPTSFKPLPTTKLSPDWNFENKTLVASGDSASKSLLNAKKDASEVASLSINGLLQDLRITEQIYFQDLTTIYALYPNKSDQQKILIGSLIDAHHRIPTNLTLLALWAIDTMSFYEAYIEGYVYCSEDSSNIKYLQKRPLVRIRYFSKLFEKLHEKSLDLPRLGAISKEYKKLAGLARKKAQDERERVDKKRIIFSKVKNFATLLPSLDYFNQDRIIDRDYFDSDLVHESGYTWSNLVVEIMLLKTEIKYGTDKGTPSIALCSLETPGRSLIFPVFQPGDLFFKQTNSKTIIKLWSQSGESIITLFCPDKEQVRKWKAILSELFPAPDNFQGQAKTRKSRDIDNKELENSGIFSLPTLGSMEEPYVSNMSQPVKRYPINPNIPTVDSFRDNVLLNLSFSDMENHALLAQDFIENQHNGTPSKNLKYPHMNLGESSHYRMARDLPPLPSLPPSIDLDLSPNFDNGVSNEVSTHDEHTLVTNNLNLDSNMTYSEPGYETDLESIIEKCALELNFVLNDSSLVLSHESFIKTIEENILHHKTGYDTNKDISLSESSSKIVREGSSCNETKFGANLPCSKAIVNKDVEYDYISHTFEPVLSISANNMVNTQEIVEYVPNSFLKATGESSKQHNSTKEEYATLGQDTKADKNMNLLKNWNVPEKFTTVKPKSTLLPTIIPYNNYQDKNSVKKFFDDSNIYSQGVSTKIDTNTPGILLTRTLQPEEEFEFINSHIKLVATQNCEKSFEYNYIPIRGGTEEASVQSTKLNSLMIGNSGQTRSQAGSYFRLAKVLSDADETQLTPTSISTLSDEACSTICGTPTTPMTPLTPPLSLRNSATSSIVLNERDVESLVYNSLSTKPQDSYMELEQEFRRSLLLNVSNDKTTTQYYETGVGDEYDHKHIMRLHKGNSNEINTKSLRIGHNSPDNIENSETAPPNIRQVSHSSSSEPTLTGSSQTELEETNNKENVLKKAESLSAKKQKPKSRKNVSFEDHIVVYDDGLSNFSQDTRIAHVSEWKNNQWRRVADSEGATIVTSICGEGGELEILSVLAHTCEISPENDTNLNEDDSCDGKVNDFKNLTETPYHSQDFGRTLRKLDLTIETSVRRANVVDIQVQLKQVYRLMIRTYSAREAEELIPTIRACCRKRSNPQSRSDGTEKRSIIAEHKNEQKPSKVETSLNAFKSIVMTTFAAPLTSILPEKATPPKVSSSPEMDESQVFSPNTDENTNQPFIHNQLNCKLFIKYSGREKWYNLGCGFISVFNQFHPSKKRVLLSKSPITGNKKHDERSSQAGIIEDQLGETIHDGVVDGANFKKCGKTQFEFYFNEIGDYPEKQEPLPEINGVESKCPKNHNETNSSIYMIYVENEVDASRISQLLHNC